MIQIKGPIVYDHLKWIYDFLEMESTSPKDVIDELEKLEPGEAVEIEINSPGGYIFAANEIYTALMKRQGEVNILITSLAASAASVIAMAGTKVKMGATSQMMIHNVSGCAEGDYREMEKVSENLKIDNESISKAYELKTGLGRDTVLSMMNNETWLTADKALELGFIDEILNKENFVEVKLDLVANSEGLIRKEVLQNFMKMKEQEKLNLLKLKGGN